MKKLIMGMLIGFCLTMGGILLADWSIWGKMARDEARLNAELREERYRNRLEIRKYHKEYRHLLILYNKAVRKVLETS